MASELGKLVSGVFNLLLGAGSQPAPAPETEAAPAKRDFRSVVKLIHADELSGLTAFPRYQDFQGIQLDQYERGHGRIEKLKHDHRDAIATLGKLIELDRGDLTAYEHLSVAVAPSFWRKVRKIALQPPKYEQTVAGADEGEVIDGHLVVRAGWLTRKVTVRYQCPTRVRHREELDALQGKVSRFSASENQAIDEIASSRFAHPVLFISHRWEATGHPDPVGSQLHKLQALKDCFIIYDYTSFPQQPMSEPEANDLKMVLKDMGELIRNVVVLDHPDYATRGWCIYEYIAACFEGSVICDEIGDPKFAALRDWVATREPIPQRLFHDGAESMVANCKEEAILSIVNEILPSFKAAEFTVDQDREIVQHLLTALLKNKLPPKRYLNPELGESSSSPWTDEELKDAFDKTLQWERLSTMDAGRSRVKVAASLQETVSRRYQVEIEESYGSTIMGMGSPLSQFFGRGRHRNADVAVWDAIRARRAAK